MSSKNHTLLWASSPKKSTEITSAYFWPTPPWRSPFLSPSQNLKYSHIYLRDDRDQLLPTITRFPSFGEGYSSGEPYPAVSASQCAGELPLQAFLWSMKTQLVALTEDYCPTANRSKARAPMLASQSKAFQILARSCFQFFRSPQLVSHSFAHGPHQVPGILNELFTETDLWQFLFSTSAGTAEWRATTLADMQIWLSFLLNSSYRGKRSESRWSMQNLRTTVARCLPVSALLRKLQQNQYRQGVKCNCRT